MKPTRTLRYFLLIAGSSMMAVSAASALDYYWDANAGTTGTGGTGTWDTSSSLWRNGSSTGTLSLWPNTASNTDNARLAGTAGTLTLNSSSVNINVNKITFGTTGYIIAGPASGTATLNLSGTTPTIDIATLANVATISAKITGSAGLTKISTGTVNLSGDNSYSGVTSITGGAIAISHANALGATGSGNQTTITANGLSTQLRFSGGINSAENITITGLTETSSFLAAILNTSGSNTLSGDITLDNPSGGIRLGSEDGSLTYSGNISQIGTSQSLRLQARNAGSSITVDNAIANNGGDLLIFGDSTKVGSSGSVTLKGVSGSGIGNTEVSQNGTLILGVTNALKTTGNVTLGSGGGNIVGRDIGTLDLAGYDQTINALNSVVGNNDNSFRKVSNSGVGTSILTLGNGGGTGTLNGQIEGDIELIKTGSGTQTLNGVNSYTGATTVSGGTLLVNGSTAAGSTVGVDSGGTLGGTGTIGGAVNVTGQLSPGASIETFATGNLSMLDGSTLIHELDSFVADTVGSDLLKVTGNLALTGTVTLTLTDLAVTDVAFAVNDTFSLINYTGAWNGGLFTFGGNELADEEVFSFGLNTWKISYNDATGGLNYDTEYVAGSFVNITAMTAIPEPSAALPGVLGMLTLLRRRRN